MLWVPEVFFVSHYIVKDCIIYILTGSAHNNAVLGGEGFCSTLSPVSANIQTRK